MYSWHLSTNKHLISATTLCISLECIYTATSSLTLRLVPILSQMNFFKLHFNIVFPYTHRSSKFSLRFLTKTLLALLSSPMPATWHVHPFLLDWSPAQYLVRSTDRESTHYAVGKSPSDLIPYRPKYLPQHPVLKHPPSFLLRQCGIPSFTPILINQLSPQTTVLPGKLTVPQLIKKFPPVYATRTFIIAFTSAGHMSIFWTTWYPSTSEAMWIVS